ncbi:hypothetical protein [Shimia ponticola]|uniref:hypothetical protein n=1 Tax=Shimia ponticola TaxID=2582893 RepID=UPI0011BF1D08|nr:hypothetical protein [Shimia ponticola]
MPETAETQPSKGGQSPASLRTSGPSSLPVNAEFLPETDGGPDINLPTAACPAQAWGPSPDMGGKTHRAPARAAHSSAHGAFCRPPNETETPDQILTTASVAWLINRPTAAAILCHLAECALAQAVGTDAAETPEAHP